MRRIGPELCCSVGVASFVGGLAALVYGLSHPAPTLVAGSPWDAETYCFLGGALAAVGSGLGTLGLLLIRGRRVPPKPGRDELV